MLHFNDRLNGKTFKGNGYGRFDGPTPRFRPQTPDKTVTGYFNCEFVNVL